MRTTVTLESDTEAIIRQRMTERSMSFKDAVNDAIRSGARAHTDQPFSTAVASMGESRVNLDRALQLAADLEDDELIRTSRRRS